MKFALIGHPLGHTLSPFIHRELFRLSGLDASYEAFDIFPEDLPDELPRLFELDGFNVTIPHKSAVLPYLSEIMGFARLCGAVNTISCAKKTGYNTDGNGMAAALNLAGLPLTGKVAVLGAGGTARTATFLAAEAGCETALIARNRERALSVAAQAKERLSAEVRVFNEIPDERFDLLINATPVGMFPNADACPLPIEQLRKFGGVFDAIYNPRETVLLREAKAQNIPAAGGMFMLVSQAAAAHKIWYGAQFSEHVLEHIAHKAQREIST